MAVHIMIKPVSSKCNLKCKYCFFVDEAKNREIECTGIIDAKTTENIIKSVFKFVHDGITFSFQGGEPTLVGLQYYVDFVKKVNELNTQKTPVTYSIQTNGTLIDKSWCQFFKDNHFMVGISLDGYKDTNIYRVTKDNKESFDSVINAINLCKEFNLDFSVLCVVTKLVGKNIQQVYEFLKGIGVKSMQFIPYISPIKDNGDEFEMTKDEYEAYFGTIFDLYLRDKENRQDINIRDLNNYIRLAYGQKAEQCGMNGLCSRQFVVEANGDVYPCDFYCLDEYRLGNINNDGFSSLCYSKKAMEFIKESFVFPEECKTCEVLNECRCGGCKRLKMREKYCEVYKKKFKELFHTRAL